jgi:hypothetical protein
MNILKSNRILNDWYDLLNLIDYDYTYIVDVHATNLEDILEGIQRYGSTHVYITNIINNNNKFNTKFYINILIYDKTTPLHNKHCFVTFDKKIINTEYILYVSEDVNYTHEFFNANNYTCKFIHLYNKYIVYEYVKQSYDVGRIYKDFHIVKNTKCENSKSMLNIHYCVLDKLFTVAKESMNCSSLFIYRQIRDAIKNGLTNRFNIKIVQTDDNYFKIERNDDTLYVYNYYKSKNLKSFIYSLYQDGILFYNVIDKYYNVKYIFSSVCKQSNNLTIDEIYTE